MPSVAADTVRPLTRLPVELRGRSIHMIGIGGSGMSGLAALLLKQGARVSGSDRVAFAALPRLLERGADVALRQTGETLPEHTELVVASAAIPKDDGELRAARQRGIPVLKYAELLGALMDRHHGIAIAGTHGKSTTTAWLAYVLKRAGLDPSFVVGAVSAQLGGGSDAGDGPHFVAEACEYDRSFHNLRPACAAVLNIEEDHLDCYRGLDEIREAFAHFAAAVPRDGLVVLNADDASCQAVAASLAAPVETFGFGESATWRGADPSQVNGSYEFDVMYNGESAGRVAIRLPGAHSVSNALTVLALARHCGVPWEPARAALGEYRGVQRRLEVRGRADDVTIVDDYGHHPTEIRATLAAVQTHFHPRRVWCVFQPHQHSRTRFLLEDFARSFGAADHVVVPDIYFVRDTQADREAVCAEDLVARIRADGGDARYIPDFDVIVAHLAREVAPGDLVITMGAGNIWKVADGLVDRLGAHLSA